ncbi:aromatic acid exporter family protein [Bacillus massiliigorillae]|uniref:aromatic acid exporter family protein n=1 Tax=Bacillus massiliigorillae TaxID=1243664 RepID=UPI0003A6256F|nr:aromatic acid exporter family protein [Bacillus massiliigorillae]
MIKIGYRTLKTAIGVAIAIYIAQILNLHSFASAGIITILCVQVTKKKSIKAAFSRLIACLIAMLYSTIFFEGIGFNPAVIGLMLLVFIPTVVAANVKEGIVTSSVIILHIYSAGHVTLNLLLNEIALLVVGMTVALIINMYMPSMEAELKKYQQNIEKNFSFIFQKMALYIRTNESNWDGKEIMVVYDMITEAKSLAFRDVENHVTRHDDLYYYYFKMREKQFEIIERLFPLVASIPSTSPYSHLIADFIDDLSLHIHPYNTSHIYLKKLEDMLGQIHAMDLPKTREEFDVQVAMMGTIKELEKYLILKSVYKGFSREKEGMKKKVLA